MKLVPYSSKTYTFNYNIIIKCTPWIYIQPCKNHHDIYYRCFIENCGKRFKSRENLIDHQKSHIYNTSIFYVKSQAFHGTTFILRKDLPEEGISDFNFVTSDECVNEVKKIVGSELVKKYSIIFSIAVTINFIKVDTDGGVELRVSPCFCSSQKYINSVSTYCIKRVLHELALDLKKRFDDFVERGSGWTMESFVYLDLHISQINDLRGACGDKIGNPVRQKLISRRAGLINIQNKDNQCLLFCIAASFVCQSCWSPEKKSNPSSYLDFVKLLKTGNSQKSVSFPISLEDILFIEEINRNSVTPILFRVNVFKEDIISHQLQLVRKSSFNDGKVVNVLLVEYEYLGQDFSHYVLIYKHSFLKKKCKL